MVVGGCGAGKTTFSLRLAELTGLPLTHLDVLGWRGNWEKVPREEFNEKLAAAVAEDRWIIDGNYNKSMPVRLERADTVFWFDFSGSRCLLGVLERFFRNYGKSRDDMGGDCPEKLDREKLIFFRDAFVTAKKTHGRIAALLEDAEDKTVIVFRTRKQADRYLRDLSAQTGGERKERDDGMG